MAKSPLDSDQLEPQTEQLAKSSSYREQAKAKCLLIGGLMSKPDCNPIQETQTQTQTRLILGRLAPTSNVS